MGNRGIKVTDINSVEGLRALIEEWVGMNQDAFMVIQTSIEELTTRQRVLCRAISGLQQEILLLREEKINGGNGDV